MIPPGVTDAAARLAADAAARAARAVRRLDLQPAPAPGSHRGVCRGDPGSLPERAPRHRRRRSHLAAPGSGRARRRGTASADGASSGATSPRRSSSDALRARVGLRVPVRVRGLRPDAARGALGRRAARRARHAGRAGGLRRRGRVTCARGDIAGTASGAPRAARRSAERGADARGARPAVLARYSWDAAADRDADAPRKDRGGRR